MAFADFPDSHRLFQVLERVLINQRDYWRWLFYALSAGFSFSLPCGRLLFCIFCSFPSYHFGGGIARAAAHKYIPALRIVFPGSVWQNCSIVLFFLTTDYYDAVLLLTLDTHKLIISGGFSVWNTSPTSARTAAISRSTMQWDDVVKEAASAKKKVRGMWIWSISCG